MFGKISDDDFGFDDRGGRRRESDDFDFDNRDGCRKGSDD
jgi:hypothetical protein